MMTTKKFITEFLMTFLCAAAALLVVWHALGLSAMDWTVPIVYVDDTQPLMYLYDVLGRTAAGAPGATGMPFGTQMYDGPTADAFNLALIDSLEFLGGSFGAGFNLYYLATVFLVGGTAYAVGRALGLERKWAFALSLLFNLVPFHLTRIVHLFYTNYMPAALATWLAIGVVGNDEARHWPKRRWWLVALCAVICGCCGIYYAFFSCLFIAIAALFAYFQTDRGLQPFSVAAAILTLILASVIVSMSPSLWFFWEHGVNPGVAHRWPWESEINGLKLAQMLLPAPYHRIPAFVALRQFYDSHAPLTAENSTATLGLIGSAGLLLLMAAPFLGRFRSQLPAAMTKAAPLAWFGFAYATIGGFGTIFAFVISPQLRALNRISVFLSFAALLGFFALIQLLCRKCKPVGTAAIFLLVTIVGVLDLTPSTPLLAKSIETYRAIYENDRKFAESVERALPDGAMVFQLPYVGFPEGATVEQLGSYEHLAPILHAKRLRWTFGAMGGRPEATWYFLTSSLAPERMIETLGKVGFHALEINRKGYADRGAAIEKSLVALGLLSDVVSNDGNMVLYKIPKVVDADHAALAVAPDGAGWGAIEAIDGGKGLWSNGDAQIQLANVAASRVSCRLSVRLSSLVARKVKLMDANAALAEVDLPASTTLQPGAPQTLSADLSLAKEQVKELRLITDVPAQFPTPGDHRKLGFFWHLPDAPLCN